MKRLKKVMIIICILIMVIVLILLTLKKNNQENTMDDETFQELERGNGKGKININTNLQKVSNKTRYYIVKNIIDEYFEYINMIRTNPETELEKEDSDFALSAILNMYNDNYRNEFKITKENLINHLQKYINCEYHIQEMYQVEKSISSNIYLVSVKIQNTGETIYFIIVTDSAKSAFEIYGDEYVKKYQYDNQNRENLSEINVEGLKQNSFNKIKNIRVTNQDIAVNYFNDYKYKMINNIEEAYDLLDQEYRTKRFGNEVEYQKYVEENREYLREIVPKQYIYNEYEDNAEYVCKDQYENIYIFKETAIMDYTVQLDTYTIMTDKFKEEYEKGKDDKKVIMNIDRFIQMINNYDYQSAYQVLNQTFKENQFGNEENFKQYMKSRYYPHNKIEITNFSGENNSTYICKATIINREKEEETKDMNIIMKLNQGTDFEMSFEIIE